MTVHFLTALKNKNPGTFNQIPGFLFEAILEIISSQIQLQFKQR
jgi:hypothetical protein